MKGVRSMRTKITIITALTLLLCVGASASDPKTHDVNNIDWKKAEVNYTAALNSANFGVRNSAAGHIGEYRLTGAVNNLVVVLRTDKVEKIRMAAALALVKIGNEKARKAVREASIYDGSEKVAKFCEQLIKDDVQDLNISIR